MSKDLETSFHRLSIDGNASTIRNLHDNTLTGDTTLACLDENTTVNESRREGMSKSQFKEKKSQYNQYVLEARNLEKQSDWHGSLLYYRSAMNLFSHDKKLARKIEKLQKRYDVDEQRGRQHQTMQRKDVDEEDDNEVIVPPAHMMRSGKEATASSVIDMTANTSNVQNSVVYERSVWNGTAVAKTVSQRGNVKDRHETTATTTTIAREIEQPQSDEHGFVENKSRREYALEAEKTNAGMLRIDSSIYETLYGYQRQCLRWLWQKYTDRSGQGGGILGDDMGLGKTVQVCSFLQGMIFQSRIVKHVMIAAPVSVLENWKKEFHKWCKNTQHGRRSPMDLFFFHGLSNANKRKEMILDFMETGGVFLTSYGMITSQVDLLSKPVHHGRDENHPNAKSLHFDMVILDEGHKIKNPSIKLSVCLRMISSDHRFLLTGTPIQSLDELWSLYDYIFEGNLLGDAKSFKANIAKKIVRAKERDASAYEKRVGDKMSLKLRQLIDPHFLRRTKAQVLSGQMTPLTAQTNANVKTTDAPIYNASGIPSSKMTVASDTRSITQKNDLICWVKCTENQVDLYQRYLKSKNVQDVLRQSISALSSLTILKQICNHPHLLPDHAEEQETDDIETTISKSGKLLLLDRLLHQLLRHRDVEQVGQHKTLIFSQSVKMLDVIVRMLEHRGITFLRIDGKTKNKERQHRIDKFNNQGIHSNRYQCFLLTTQVGAFGITLTTADRVVLFDPSWNPAQDDQAVDRAYRIGQSRNVIVYRFITCSTIEEKIYRKQVFKGLLSKTAIQESRTKNKKKDNNKPVRSDYRFFTNQELRQLFEFGNPKVSETQQQLVDIMKNQGISRLSYPELDRHVHALSTREDIIKVLFGLSDHDRLFDAKENMNTVEHSKMDQSVIDNTVNQSMIQLLNSSTANVNDSSMIVKPIPLKKHQSSDASVDVSARLLPMNFSIHNTTQKKEKKKKKNKKNKKKESAQRKSSVKEVMDAMSHDQRQVCKGVRLHGEKSRAWPTIVQQFLCRYHINASYAEAMWTKLKESRGSHILKKVLVAMESDLERAGYGNPLPTFPKLAPAKNEQSDDDNDESDDDDDDDDDEVDHTAVVIDLDDSVNASEDASDNARHATDTSNTTSELIGEDGPFKPLLPTDLVQQDGRYDGEQLHEFSLPEIPGTPITAACPVVEDALSNWDSMFSPIPAAEKGPRPMEPASPIVLDASISSSVVIPRTTSPDKKRESLAQVARRLSKCFGLLDKEDEDEDEENEDGDNDNVGESRDAEKYDSEESEEQDDSFIDDNTLSENNTSGTQDTTVDSTDSKWIDESPVLKPVPQQRLSLQQQQQRQRFSRPIMPIRRLKKNVIYDDSDDSEDNEEETVNSGREYAEDRPSDESDVHTYEENYVNLEDHADGGEAEEDDDDDTKLERLSTRLSSVSISEMDLNQTDQSTMLSMTSSNGSMMRDISSLAEGQNSSVIISDSDMTPYSFQNSATDGSSSGVDYEHLVRIGHQREQAGDLVGALDYYMRALDFNDEDILLHGRCCALATRLGWMEQT